MICDDGRNFDYTNLFTKLFRFFTQSFSFVVDLFAPFFVPNSQRRLIFQILENGAYYLLSLFVPLYYEDLYLSFQLISLNGV